MPSRLQSAGLVAAVAELGLWGASPGLNGSLFGSARFISLLPIMEDARFLLRIGVLTVGCAAREMGFLCFNIELVVIYQTKLFDPEQLTTSNFGRRLVPVCDLQLGVQRGQGVTRG